MSLPVIQHVLSLFYSHLSSASYYNFLACLLRFHRTYGPYHLILSYLPLSRSTLPLSHADTSDCPFHISYPLSPHIFDRPWYYLVALFLSSYL